MTPSSAHVGSSERTHLSRGAQAIRRFLHANPILALAGQAYRDQLARVESAPETMSLADRFGFGRVVEEAATWEDDAELRTLGAAIIDDVLTIAATHAGEAAILLQDVAEPERTVRYLRLLKSRLDAMPAPARAPVDPEVEEGMRESVRSYLLAVYPHMAER